MNRYFLDLWSDSLEEPEELKFIRNLAPNSSEELLKLEKLTSLVDLRSDSSEEPQESEHKMAQNEILETSQEGSRY